MTVIQTTKVSLQKISMGVHLKWKTQQWRKYNLKKSIKRIWLY